MEMRAGELVARVLKKEGVSHSFGICGGHTITILKGLSDQGIKYVDTHHEQAAVHMADAFARITGQLGVAVVTAGPGVVNAVPGIATAQSMGVPVLLLAGRSTELRKETGEMQDMDQEELMRPLTKWARTCRDPQRVPEYVAMAVREAFSGRPGPVFLDFPTDVINKQIDEEQVVMPEGYRSTARPAGDPAAVSEAMSMLTAARRPVIYAGSGAAYANAGEELKALSAATGIPVIAWKGAQGLIPEDDPLAAGLAALPVADAVLVVGSRLDWMVGHGKPPMIQMETTLIQVDIEASELGRNRRMDVGIVGDAKLVLRQMLDELPNCGPFHVEDGWPARSESPTASVDVQAASDTLNIAGLCVGLRGTLDRDAIVPIDGGETQMFGTKLIPALAPHGNMWAGPFGQLGVGVPFGIAAKLACPDRQVVVLTGDGAFGLCAMEMLTAIRHEVPITVVVANDAAWNMIQVDNLKMYGEACGTGTVLNPARYDRMVEALGGHGEFVQTAGELPAALERAFASGKPALVNVVIDPTLSHKRKGGIDLI